MTNYLVSILILNSQSRPLSWWFVSEIKPDAKNDACSNRKQAGKVVNSATASVPARGRPSSKATSFSLAGSSKSAGALTQLD
ncbi:MAG TPA: hypothetical protein IGS52_01510 [Oscillatoriaceae cyanobacterium M33_DOE_052]|uniref:Uncharacterized protein n=1 Tax=Planktothricoides sp. SpSt-374 TaxID=2282167 RepID=A0A7C3VMR1_9CYAN|nr:hypothetical protein [Oscillatoriaceae cyanobacterium M33_DOE_052]